MGPKNIPFKSWLWHLTVGSLSPGFNLVEQAQIGVRATLRLKILFLKIDFLGEILKYGL